MCDVRNIATAGLVLVPVRVRAVTSRALWVQHGCGSLWALNQPSRKLFCDSCLKGMFWHNIRDGNVARMLWMSSVMERV